jgi:hypothetical protein
MTNTTTALQALEEIAYRAKIAAGMTRPDEGPAQVFQQLARIARDALAAPAAQDAPSERPAGRVLYGDEPLDDQSYTPIAARASQPATPAQDAVATVPTGVQHELKTDPEVFAAVFDGRKTFEIRRDDRGFNVGDSLRLRETASTGEQMRNGAPLQYTGREVTRIVSHVLSGYGLMEGWVCLSLAAPTAPQAPALVPISVDDELPPKNQEVFICFAGQNTLWSTGQYTGRATDVNGWCYPAENRGMTDDGSDPVVTHWLPMFDVPAGITPTTKEQQ